MSAGRGKRGTRGENSQRRSLESLNPAPFLVVGSLIIGARLESVFFQNDGTRCATSILLNGRSIGETDVSSYFAQFSRRYMEVYFKEGYRVLRSFVFEVSENDSSCLFRSIMSYSFERTVEHRRGRSGQSSVCGVTSWDHGRPRRPSIIVNN